MGLWPTRGNENQRRPRESGDPLRVGRKMDSRFRGYDVRCRVQQASAPKDHRSLLGHTPS